jgi:FtsP/CotA-like multicopper oxidase with cupredoxin domain
MVELQSVKKAGLALGILAIALWLGTSNALAGTAGQTPLAGSAIPKFQHELPTLSLNTQSAPKISTIFGNQPLTIRMCEFDANVLPTGTPLAVGATGKTRVWGYVEGDTCPTTPQDTYIGPVIVNDRGSSTDITWVNALGYTDQTQVLAWLYSSDQTLHWADPLGGEANECMMNLEMMNYLDPAGNPVGYPPYGDPCSLNYGEDPFNLGTFLHKPIPAVVHLHGGEVPPELDGGPDAWFTSDGAFQGHGYYSFGSPGGNAATYNYPNTQEAAPIWFHDHVLGMTRLNVYAGLAGAYFIQDLDIIPQSVGGNCDPLAQDCLPANLHPLSEVVPVAIQDRMFDTNGQLFFQADSNGGLLWATNPEHPYWSPEFVGDTIVVNGKAWPFLNVQAKRYRFLFLNGSNARTYELFLVNPVTKAMGPSMWVISTDGGYLDNPVKIDPALGQKLIMQPGERYGVIIDFGPFANTSLIIRNTGRTPYPKGVSPQGSTLGQIMQFRVGAAPASDTSYNPDPLAVDYGGPLRTGTNRTVRLVDPLTGTLAAGVTVPLSKTRQLTLNEVMGMPMTAIDPVTGITTAYPGGPMEILVNNTKWNGGVDHAGNCLRPDFTQITVGGITTCYSEIPQEGDTEVWEIVNLTADAHPIHLHLVQFQLINRQNFNVNKYNQAYATAFPTKVFQPGYGPPLSYGPSTASGGKQGGNPDITRYLQGPQRPPLPQEAGWKDTVITYPGQLTRIAVRWAPTDLPTTSAATDLHFPFDPSDGNHHGYVWHCHIIDHEDNEMMRPDVVDLNPAAPAPAGRPLVLGRDY